MLKVRLADSPYLQEKGLMFEEFLPEDEGMLFDFKRPQMMSFWGANTFLPLDIAFVDDKNIIVKIGHIMPHCLKSVTSDCLCVAAIEANKGYFAENEIEVGDEVELVYPKNKRSQLDVDYWDGPSIVFHKANEKNKGISTTGENTNKAILPNKQSQNTFVPTQNAVGYSPTTGVKGISDMKVDKKGKEPIGQPVTENVDGRNLPVIGAADLGKILEDSYDEEKEPVAPTEEEIPTEEIPGEQPTEVPPEPEKEFPVFSNAFEATEWAEKNSEVMRISYTTKRGRQLTRDVEPHGKFHAETTNHTILVVYDETIGDIRAFIVNNISSWAFVNKKFDKKFVVRA